MTTTATEKTKMTKKGLREKKDIFLMAFRAKAGLVSPSCEAASVHRSSFYRWFEKDRRFRAAVEDVREELLDIAESKLLVAVRNGEGWAVRFFLESKGRHRGWSRRMELSGPDGEPLLTAREKEIAEGVAQAKRIIMDPAGAAAINRLLEISAGRGDASLQ